MSRATGLWGVFATTAMCLGFSHAGAAQAPSGAQPNRSTAPEEIIVTARRRAERLQSVPISISVLSQKQLTDRNVTSGADLATYVPSLGVQNLFGNDNASYVLRGFYQQSSTAPTVGVYFDDVAAPRGGIGAEFESAGDGAGPGSFFDLQNVQVVKGPQGTLFGRNTTGGALLLVPQKPTSGYGGYLEVSAGNYGMERTQGVVNLPISDRVRLRLGFDQETRDGYLKNLSGIGPSNFDDINYGAFRASLVVDVTDDIENYTVASFSQSDTNGPGEQMYACNNKIEIFSQLSCDQLHHFGGNQGYNIESDLPDARDYNRQWQVVNTTTWNATDDLTVKNIAGYAQYQGTLASGLFGTDYIIPKYLDLALPGGGVFKLPTGTQAGKHLYFTATDSPPGMDISNQATYSEELQLHGTTLNDRLDWQGGFYMEGSVPLSEAGTLSPTLASCTNIAALQCTDSLQSIFSEVGVHEAFGEVQTQIGEISYHDYALYGQGTYTILPDLKFTAGVRGTNDTSAGSATRQLWGFPAPNQPVHACLAGVTDPASCYSSLRTSSTAPTWLLDLDYTPVKDLLTYVKWARGYRAGGLVLSGVPGYDTFEPERVDNYEIGEKYSFHGPVSGIFDLDGFYNNFFNQQLPIGFVVPPGSGLGSPSGSIANVGKSRIWGVEAEAGLQYNGISLDLSYTYLNTKVEQVSPPAVVPGSPFTPITDIVEGGQLLYTPRNKVALSATYRLPLADYLGRISVGGNYVFTGSELSGTTGPNYIIPSYSLLNFNVNWESVYNKPFDLEFFMTNVTNNFYATNESDYSNILGFSSRSIGEPRMFGFRLRYHFGHA